MREYSGKYVTDKFNTLYKKNYLNVWRLYNPEN